MHDQGGCGQIIYLPESILTFLDEVNYKPSKCTVHMQLQSYAPFTWECLFYEGEINNAVHQHRNVV